MNPRDWIPSGKRAAKRVKARAATSIAACRRASQTFTRVATKRWRSWNGQWPMHAAALWIGVMATLSGLLPGPSRVAPRPAHVAFAEESRSESAGKASAPCAQLTVRTRSNRGPVSGARITFWPRKAAPRGAAKGDLRTNASGEATLFRLSCGGWHILVEANGYARAERAVDIAPPQTSPPSLAATNSQTLDVELVRGASLRGVVVDESNRPIAGARAEARHHQSFAPWTAMTDERGEFSIRSLPRNQKVSIRVAAAGYAEDAQTARTDDQIRSVLRSAATVSGRVLDPQGRPAEQADVWLVGSGVWPPVHIRSDASGHFSWPDVPPGVYEIGANGGQGIAKRRRGLVVGHGGSAFVILRLERAISLRGRVVSKANQQGIADAEIVITDDEVDLIPSATRTDKHGKFSVRRLPSQIAVITAYAEGFVPSAPLSHDPASEALVIEMEPEAVVSGVVVDARGRSVAGARIDIVRDANGETSQSGFSGAGLDGAAPGLGNAGVSSSLGLGTTTGPVPPIFAAPMSSHESSSSYDPGPTAPAIRSLSLDMPTTDNHGRFEVHGLPAGKLQLVVSHPDYAPEWSSTLHLNAGQRRSGVRVVLPKSGTVRGKVVDRAGFPAARVLIELRAEREPHPRTAVTESDGAFEFRGTLGPVTLTASPIDQPAARARATVVAGQIARVRIELAGDFVTLSGRVVDRSRFPITNVEISLLSLNPRAPVSKTTLSRSDGTFEITGLPPPPYRVTANHDRHAPKKLGPVRKAGDPLRIVLDPAGTVRGSVVDDWSSEPVSAEVSLKGSAGTKRTHTAEDGSFRFSRLGLGEYTVVVQSEAHVSATARVSVAASKTGVRPVTIRPIRLKPGGIISGEVVDALGRPTSDAEIHVRNRTLRVVTDTSGQFSVSGLPPGSHEIWAAHSGGGTTPAQRVRVYPSDETSGVRFKLPQRRDAPSADPAAQAMRSGVAIRVADEDNGVRIVAVRPGSSAEQAGLKAGDTLRSVDRKAMTSAAEARQHLRGPVGIEAVIETDNVSIPIQRERYSADF